MPLRPAALLAAVAGLAVPAAAQAAPVLDPLKPCYVAVGVDPVTGQSVTEKVQLSGSGFTPSSTVTIALDGGTAASDVPVDAAGVLATEVGAPFQEHGQRVFDVTVTEQQNGAQTVTAQSLVTRLEVWAKPRIAKPRQRIRFTGAGFTAPGRGVYAHYIRSGKVRETVRLASRPDGACGTFSVKRRQFPFRHPHVGKWIVRVDQQRRYKPDSSAAYTDLRILVKPTLQTG